MIDVSSDQSSSRFYVYAHRVLPPPLLLLCCYTAVGAAAAVLLLPAAVRHRVLDGQILVLVH